MSRSIKIIVYVLFILIFQEVVFRTCFPLPDLSNFNRASFVLKDGQTGAYVRNQQYGWWSMPDTNMPLVCNYNMYGFRDSEWEVARQRGVKRFMFVGDSFIEGIMAEGHQTIPKVFERQFSEPVETMNAGMLGVDVEKYLQFIADAVPVFKPDVVFLVIYANDFTSEEIAIPNFNLKEEYFTSGKPRLLELIDQYKAGNPVPFVKSFSTKKLLPNITDIAFPYKGRIDEMFLHADSSLVNYMLKAEYNLFKLNEMFRAEKKLREPSNLLVPLDFFRYYAEKYEFEPVVVFLPSRNQVTNHYLQFDYQSSLKFNRNISFTDSIYNVNQARLGEVCSRLGLKYYDFTEEIKKQESAGNHLYWNYDDHMRAKGYRLIGEELFRRWSR